MATLLKVNVTVSDLGHVHGTAHQLKELAQHLRYENSQIEITVAPGRFPDAGAVTPEQIQALSEFTSTLKASNDQLDKAVHDAADSPQPK